MHCQYCHGIGHAANGCNCYLVETSECLTCLNCYRVQNLPVFQNDILKNVHFSESSNKTKMLIFEIGEKLYISRDIVSRAYDKFLSIKKQILNSTKNHLCLIAYSLKAVCNEEGIILPLKKIYSMVELPTRDYYATQNFLFKKKIKNFKAPSLKKKCDSILLCLGVFNPKIRHILFLQCRKMVKITDYKIENICASVFILYEYTLTKKKNLKKKFKLCEEKLAVKIYSLKKIIKKKYNLVL